MPRIAQTIIAAMLITTSYGMAQPGMDSTHTYTHAEVRKMIREANSSQQYQQLASYFKSRQDIFEKQAQAEKQEWDRRKSMTTSFADKYPRPADSSRNRYDYFTYEADQMGQLAGHYQQLADGRSSR